MVPSVSSKPMTNAIQFRLFHFGAKIVDMFEMELFAPCMADGSFVEFKVNFFQK